MRLFRTSAALCVGALFLAPLAGRSSIDIPAQHGMFTEAFETVRLPLSDHKQTLTVVRDPFIAPVSAAAVATGTPSSNVVGMMVHQGQPTGYVALRPAGTVLRAIVSGLHPMALVEESGQPRLVKAGDTLAEGRVVRIDAHAVFLDGGQVLKLPEDAR